MDHKLSIQPQKTQYYHPIIIRSQNRSTQSKSVQRTREEGQINKRTTNNNDVVQLKDNNFFFNPHSNNANAQIQQQKCQYSKQQQQFAATFTPKQKLDIINQNLVKTKIIKDHTFQTLQQFEEGQEGDNEQRIRSITLSPVSYRNSHTPQMVTCDVDKQNITTNANGHTKNATLMDKYQNIIANNNEYFRHLEGKCKNDPKQLGNINCDTKKLKYIYQTNQYSQYQKEFIQKGQQTISPKAEKQLILDCYKNYQNTAQQTFDKQTTQQIEYCCKQPAVAIKIQKSSDKLTQSYLPQDIKTTYGITFRKYPEQKNIMYYPIENLFVPHKLKMDLETEKQKVYRLSQFYNRESQKNTYKNASSGKQSHLCLPIQMDLNVNQKSLYKNQFLKYKLADTYTKTHREYSQDYSLRYNTEYKPIPSFEGQYQSTQQNFYPKPNENNKQNTDKKQNYKNNFLMNYSEFTLV